MAHGKVVHRGRMDGGNKVSKLIAMKQKRSKEQGSPGRGCHNDKRPPIRPASQRVFYLPIEQLVTMPSALTRNCRNKGPEQQVLSGRAGDEKQRPQKH